MSKHRTSQAEKLTPQKQLKNKERQPKHRENTQPKTLYIFDYSKTNKLKTS